MLDVDEVSELICSRSAGNGDGDDGSLTSGSDMILLCFYFQKKNSYSNKIFNGNKSFDSMYTSSIKIDHNQENNYDELQIKTRL